MIPGIGVKGAIFSGNSIPTGFNALTASFVRSFTLPLSFADGAVTDIHIKPDGLKLFAAESRSIIEYTNNSANTLASQTTMPTKSLSLSYPVTGLWFNNTGTYMFVLHSGYIRRYTLGTAWDINTAGNMQSKSTSNSGNGMFISSDGTKLYINESGNARIRTYTLTTAWDVTTASSSTTWTYASLPTGANGGIVFDSTGTIMYISGASAGTRQYTLTTAWDVTTASLAYTNSNISSKSYSLNGNYLFTAGSISDYARVFDISSGFSSVTNHSSICAIRGAVFRPISIKFSNTGYKLYVLDDYKNTLFQYSLSTSFDISTLSYDFKYVNFSSQDSGITGIAFNSTGSKLYAVGATNDRVYSYNVSTAWDIGTASYSTYRAISALGIGDSKDMVVTTDDAYAIIMDSTDDKAYKSSLSATVLDGTLSTLGDTFVAFGSGKSLVTSVPAGTLYQYSLSEDNNILTASLVGSVSIGAHAGLAFKQTGGALHTCSSYSASATSIKEYSIS